MPLSQWKIHCAAKRTLKMCRQTRQSMLLLVWNKVSIQSINTILWLFNVSWQITVAPQFKRHVNQSSFHIYLKHEINVNEHLKVFYFNYGKTQYAPFFKFKSTKVNLLSCLLSCLFCLSDKNGRFCVMNGQIASQSSSLWRVSWIDYDFRLNGSTHSAYIMINNDDV